MEVEVLKRVVEDQRREMEEKFAREKMVQREKLDFAARFLKHPNILAVLGVRRSGKSIFSVMLAKKLGEEFGYINFDDERLAGIKTSDLDKVLQAFYELHGKIDLVILDEVQNVEKWELFANRLRTSKKVIITGSNSQLLSGELATALTGRHVDVLIYPFSFREFLGPEFKPSVYLAEDIAKTRKKLGEYIDGSGFPEFLKFGSEIVARIYEDVVNKDCIRRHRVRNEKSFREVAGLLTSNFSREFTYSGLSKTSMVKDVHTVKNYVDYLKQAFVIQVLERFSFKLKEQVIAPKKAYAIDQGFANFIGFRTSSDRGRLFENIVCADLTNRLAAKHGTSIYYYKDALGREVDFVVKQGRRVTRLIQVCYSADDLGVKQRETKSLLKASKELKCNNLLVITNDLEAVEKTSGKKIRFTPLWKFLLQQTTKTP